MVAPIPDEAELIDEAMAGDAEAFGRLYQHLHGAVYRYIYTRVQNPSDAEDLTSQVFLKAWEALPRYERRDVRFASWVFRIAHNTAVDYLRARHRERYPLQLEEADPVAPAPAALDRLIADEEREHLTQAIARLPEVQRRVIQARFFEERSYPEIAALVAKSMGACRVIQHRALSTLNQLLKSSLSAILLVALLFGGTIYASERAIPGDVNYPVKRIVEQSRLAGAADAGLAAAIRLDFALRRLDEAERLLAAGRLDLVRATLGEAVAHLEAAEQALAADETTPAGSRLQLARQALALRAAYEGRLDALAAATQPETATLVDAARTRYAAVANLAIVILAPPVEIPPGVVAPSPEATVSPVAPTAPPPAEAAPPSPIATAAPPTAAPPTAAPPTAAPPTAAPPAPTAAPPAPPTAAPPTAAPPAPTSAPPAAPPAPTATPEPTAPPPPSPTAAPPTAPPAPSATPEPPSATPEPPSATPEPTPTAPSGPGLPPPELSGTVITQLLPPALALRPGERADITLVVANGRGAPVTLQLSATLPPQLSYVAGTASGGGRHDAGGNTLSWDGRSVAPGEVVTISFAVAAGADAAPGVADLRARAVLGPDGPEERALQLTVLILPRV